MYEYTLLFFMARDTPQPLNDSYIEIGKVNLSLGQLFNLKMLPLPRIGYLMPLYPFIALAYSLVVTKVYYKRNRLFYLN